MLNRKSFQDKPIKEAEEYFHNVHMTQEQHHIFLDFVKIFEKYIPLPDIAVKGIGWRAVKEWQLAHKRDLQGLISETPEERIKSISEILRNFVKLDLLEKLVDQKDEPLVDKAIEDTLDFYKKEYAYR